MKTEKLSFNFFSSLFIICLSLLMLSCSSQKRVKANADPQFHLYLLVGQSNMAGRGKVDALSTPENPRLLMFNKNNEWELAKDPLHFDKPDVAGVGPGLAFGLKMLDYTHNKDVRIGLIPCAVGGTAIDMWQPGKDAYDGKYHPYDDTIIRLREAMKYGVVKGIIWHQGEGDSNEAQSKVYMEKLEKLIQRFRDEINDPDLPFVAGELGYYRKNSFYINEVIKNLPEKVSMTAVADAEGLSHKGDGTHLDSESSRILGERYALKMRVLQLMNRHN